VCERERPVSEGRKIGEPLSIGGMSGISTNSEGLLLSDSFVRTLVSESLLTFSEGCQGNWEWMRGGPNQARQSRDHVL